KKKEAFFRKSEKNMEKNEIIICENIKEVESLIPILQKKGILNGDHRNFEDMAEIEMNYNCFFLSSDGILHRIAERHIEPYCKEMRITLKRIEAATYIYEYYHPRPSLIEDLDYLDELILKAENKTIK